MDFFSLVSLVFIVACPVLFYLWRVAQRTVEARDKTIKSLQDEVRMLKNVYRTWSSPPLATNWEVTDKGVSVKTADDQVHVLESLVGKGILFGFHEDHLQAGNVLGVHDRYLLVAVDVIDHEHKAVTRKTWSHVNVLHIKATFEINSD